MLVAVVFHHHQPWYMDMEGRFAFRWIFDHTRNYRRHLDILGDNEGMHITYNLSPTLLRQWKIISSGSYGLKLDGSLPDMDEQRREVSALLDGYRKLNGRNIEVLSQPYYHPIMPLLNRHGLEDDLSWQLAAGKTESEEYTGRSVTGMWSPECAFSMGVAAAVSLAGFKYTVLDGTALVGGGRQERPYRLGKGPLLFFRDNEISNAFSFSWPMQKKEVMERELASMLGTRLREGWKSVVIALDGENWMNGEDHLGALWHVLSSTQGISSATLGEVVNQVEEGTIDTVPDTSWALDHSFSTWEGSRAKNQQWALIDSARDAIAASAELDNVARARSYLRIAEGSDYTYWDFERPGALTLFGMAYATAARDIASSGPVRLP